MNTSIPSRADIILVDDDQAFCDTLARALMRRGFNVITAQDIATAKALVRESPPRYAIVDLCIGEESGLHVVQYLHSLDREMSIVVLTGYASIATAVEAVKLGATHYLTKPMHPNDIVASFGRDTGNAAHLPTPKPMSVRRLEWEHLQRVLLEHNGNISAAARALNMHRRTLQRKLQKRPVIQ